MACLFCRSEENLTAEHVFPAFMGGELKVPGGSCKRCNHEFGVSEAAVRREITPLLNLLRIRNRYDLVPNERLRADIRGLT